MNETLKAQLPFLPMRAATITKSIAGFISKNIPQSKGSNVGNIFSVTELLCFLTVYDCFVLEMWTLTI